MEKLAQLNVSPKQCLADQSLRIIAEHLQPRKPYTIAAFCRIPEASDGFQAHAFYVANDIGTIDLNTTPSSGGSFIGVEPMGLIWSMENLNDNELIRNVKKLRLQEPTTSYEIVFSIYAGHKKPPATTTDFDKTSNNSLITQAVIERIFHAANVVRVQVRKGRLRGALYAPIGYGPYQGVLDISSIPPRRLFDHKARLLASHGFVTFAAGCTSYDGSPDADHLELEYFLECVEWLSSLPQVAKTGIAITAQCVGGTIASYLALFSPLVKGVVTINSCSYFTDIAMTYKGKKLSKFIDISKIENCTDGYQDFLLAQPVIENLTVPIEKSAGDISFLLIAGEDDRIVNPDHARHLVRRLEQAGRHKFKLITYPRVGHLLAVPNAPFVPNCPMLFSDNRYTKQVHAGGEMYSHARAQDDAWEEMLKFLTKLTSQSKI